MSAHTRSYWCIILQGKERPKLFKRLERKSFLHCFNSSINRPWLELCCWFEVVKEDVNPLSIRFWLHLYSYWTWNICNWRRTKGPIAKRVSCQNTPPFPGVIAGYVLSCSLPKVWLVDDLTVELWTFFYGDKSSPQQDVQTGGLKEWGGTKAE